MRRPGGEREPGARVDLDLVHADGPVLDRVLDRRQLAVRGVEDLQAGVERRRLARAGRADDDDGAERLVDRVLAGPRWLRGHMPSSSSESGASPWVEDAQRHLLAVGGRQDRDADVDVLVAAPDRDAAVLRRAPLGDVEPAHDLEAARHGARLRAGDRGELAHDAVDPDADVEPPLLRREVDVRGAEVERLRRSSC